MMQLVTKKPVILLVDDDPAMLRLLAKWLESEGYTVRCAHDGRQAMESVIADCPHILVTDWEMPVVDGMELCRWVRRADLPNYVYTIFLTVRSGSNDMVRGLEAGADDFLKKPVDRGELLARIRAGMRVLELESKLSLLAKLDSLTGLPTQRSFYEEAGKEWGRSSRHQFPLACVMLDLDFFKRINDTHGHAVGDHVIREVARVLRENSRATDIVSRFGGEEFCILLPEASEADAALWAERVRRQVADLRMPLDDGSEFSVTASLGVAERTSDTTTPTSLVERADQALLMAKRLGRDRVVPFQELRRMATTDGAWDNRALLFNGVTARNVMTTIVAGMLDRESVGQATRYFLQFRISSAPVVDNEGQLVGILSDKDCLLSMLTPGWSELPIASVMKTNVICYDEETPVQTIYEFLCRVSIRSVVITSQGKPTGVITRGSLLRWASNVLRSQNTSAPHSCDATGVASPRERITRTAAAMSRISDELTSQMAGAGADLMPQVIGNASRMQELVNDLLACSRYVNAVSDQASEAERDFSRADADCRTGLAMVARAHLETGAAG